MSAGCNNTGAFILLLFLDFTFMPTFSEPTENQVGFLKLAFPLRTKHTHSEFSPDLCERFTTNGQQRFLNVDISNFLYISPVIISESIILDYYVSVINVFFDLSWYFR